jgi:glucose-1-phosphate thymidylyltransferase
MKKSTKQVKKGIILAGGRGSRLYPATLAVSKQLLPVWDKPMIYYPLSMLMLGGIKDILIIASPENIDQFKMLGDGSQYGIKISYTIQQEPKGIAHALRCANDFLKNCNDEDPFCLFLGDNIFYGKNDWFIERIKKYETPTVFGYTVVDPERFGVVQIDENQNIISIEEKPKYPKSNLAIPGVYILDKSCMKWIQEEQKPSARGEWEITDVIKWYAQQDKMKIKEIGIGVTWFDTGTPESLLECSQFIYTIERNHGVKIGCIEEIAYNMKFIDFKKFKEITRILPTSSYKQYLLKKISILNN